MADAFPDALPDLTSYAALLATDGVVRGLIGPREVPRLWERHILNCAVVEELIGRGRTVADVGSGAGLPGLVLAIVRPDLRVTLIEPLLRRSQFLAEVVEKLDLGNVEVVRSRAEDLKGRSFDVVTSRAVAPLDRLTRWCAPLVAPGGQLLALKGQRAVDELTEHGGVVTKAGLLDARVVTVGPSSGEQTTIVVARKGEGRVGR